MREVGCRLSIAIGSSQETSATHQNEIIPLREVERLALCAMPARAVGCRRTITIGSMASTASKSAARSPVSTVYPNVTPELADRSRAACVSRRDVAASVPLSSEVIVIFQGRT